MPRMLDADCEQCDHKIRDHFVMQVPETLTHTTATGEVHPMQLVYAPRPHGAEWSDRDAVVVFRKPDGTIAYPARNDIATPQGCERIVMKSLRQVERFERQHGVINEAAHYDRGSGNGAEMEGIRRPPSEREREAAFMKAWR